MVFKDDMTFRDYIAEMHMTLLELNFENSHEATWDQSRSEAIREVLEMLEEHSIRLHHYNNHEYIYKRVIGKISKKFGIKHDS